MGSDLVKTASSEDLAPVEEKVSMSVGGALVQAKETLVGEKVFKSLIPLERPSFHCSPSGPPSGPSYYPVSRSLLPSGREHT